MNELIIWVDGGLAIEGGHSLGLGGWLALVVEGESAPEPLLGVSVSSPGGGWSRIRLYLDTFMLGPKFSPYEHRGGEIGK